MGLGQLSSPPVSACALADWFVAREAHPDVMVGFNNPAAPLASIEMLVSPAQNYQCCDGTVVAPDEATRRNIERSYDAWVERAKAHPDNIAGVLLRLAEAEQAHREALDIRRELAQANPPAYLPGVAGSLNNRNPG